MLKKDLATALGLSASMVSRLAAAGMPVDSIAAARRWRETHLSTARRKEYRAPSMPRTQAPSAHGVEAAAQAAYQALDYVQAMGRAAGRLLAEHGTVVAIEPELRQALRQVPAEYRDKIGLAGSPDEFGQFLGKPAAACPALMPGEVSFPLTVWESLIGSVLAEARAFEAELVEAGEVQPVGQRADLTDDEADEMAAFWYAVACGEVTIR